MIAPIDIARLIVSDAAATIDRVGIHGRLREAQGTHAAALSDFLGDFAAVIGTSSLLVEPREM